MTREEAIDFLECRRAYYISLSTDTNPHVKATKICGYTLAESANACLMAIKALKIQIELDKIIDKIRVIEYVEHDVQALKEYAERSE
jgi:ribosomal protein L13E